MRATVIRCGWVLGALLAVTFAVVGAAWACVIVPVVSIQPRASGAAGSQVTVLGSGVGNEAEVRWNSLDGPVLAKVTGPSFSVSVTIPQVDQGLYVILVVDRAQDGSVDGAGRAEFLVTAGGAPSPASPTPTVTPKAARSSGLSTSETLIGSVGLLVAGAAISFVAWRVGRKQGVPAVDAPTPV